MACYFISVSPVLSIGLLELKFHLLGVSNATLRCDIQDANCFEVKISGALVDRISAISPLGVVLYLPKGSGDYREEFRTRVSFARLVLVPRQKPMILAGDGACSEVECNSDDRSANGVPQ